MRIMIAWPGHMHSTADVAYGYEQAFKRLGHDVWNYDYHNRLTFYAEAITHYAEKDEDFRHQREGKLKNDVMVLASEPIVTEILDAVPDVVFVVCGLSLHRRAYELMHRLGVPAVVYFTESPYADETQAAITAKGHLAAALTNDKNSVEVLVTDGGPPVRYLPHSFDRQVHKQRNGVPAEYESDVFFYGTLWPERERTFEPLLQSVNGHDVKVGGIPPVAEGPIGEIDIPVIDNTDMAYFYSGTRVAINHHRTTTVVTDEGDEHIAPGAAYSLGPRAYEIAACGAFQACDDVRPELRDVFGDTVATYSDGDELRDKVDYYLCHDDERREMARAAHERVQDCSFEKRAEEIVIPIFEEVSV